jgi:hypothetical protein
MPQNMRLAYYVFLMLINDIENCVTSFTLVCDTAADAFDSTSVQSDANTQLLTELQVGRWLIA